MAKLIEKRSCRRFLIPGATLTFRRKRWFRFSQGTESPVPVTDVSKGGLSFLCSEALRKKETLRIRLEIPGEKTLDLFGRVIWCSQSMFYPANTGVQFMPFTDEKGTNPTWALNVLRRMDHRYGYDEKKARGISMNGKKKSKINLDEIIF